MSEPTNQVNDDALTAPMPVKLRLWPAAIVIGVYACLYSISIFTPTIILNAIGLFIAPAVAALLLTIWWLGFSRAPMRDRLAGFAIVVVAAVWIVLTQKYEGPRVLVLAVPILTVGTVLTFFVTARLPWATRRLIALLIPVACIVAFPFFRVEDVSGNLAPIMTWRWTPNSEDLVVASSGAATNAKADVPQLATPTDWPAFRGASREGIVTGVQFATNWTEAPPKELWRKHVGLGYSSFVAVGNYVFTQEQRHEDEVTVCYQADTGQEIWANSIKARFEDSTGSGPRATPAFDGGKIYSQGALGLLQCIDAATGATIWTQDIKADTGASLPQWGFASSPLVTDKLVIVFAGGPGGKAVAAYDKLSGEKAWFAGAGGNGYSSAHLATIDGVPQVMMMSNVGVESFDPASGAALWSHEWPTSMNTRVVQPMIVDGNSVLVGTAEEKGTRLLQVSKTDTTWSAAEKWTTKSFRPYFNDYILYQGHCYGFDGNLLVCIDAHTGDLEWKGKRYGGQLILVADIGTLLVLGEKGELVLVKATPEAFTEVAKIKAIKGKTWNHPVIANGKLFVRNAEEAACFELPLLKAESAQ